jgi:protein required for attachment to host cells
MSALKVSTGAWVVVCDGRKALILENIGDRISPNLRQLEVCGHSDARTSELGTDAPGRVHPSTGAARSSVEQTDWHDEAEREFLQALATRLDKAVTAGETRGLVVVAPPRALGMLRKAYTASIQGALRKEVDKDLVRKPIYEIEKHLFS